MKSLICFSLLTLSVKDDVLNHETFDFEYGLKLWFGLFYCFLKTNINLY